MFSLKLKELRENSGLSQKAFSQKIGVSQSTVGMWESNKREPNFETTEKIADYFKVSTDYLLGRETEPTSGELDIISFDNVYPVELKRFPLLGEIACGRPIYANEDHESYVMASSEIKADFCLKAKGDSMIGARIHDGDIVFIQKQPIVQNGEIAAVIIDDEATLKRWYYTPDKNKLILNAENPAYAPLVFIDEELNSVRCLGKAVCFMSDL